MAKGLLVRIFTKTKEMNLFQEAKKEAPVTAAKKSHEEFEIKDVEFNKDLVRLAAVNQQLDELDAESKLLSAAVKERSIKEYLKVFKEKGKFPETVIFRSIKASLMFLAQDRYIKIDQERAHQLKTEYNKDIVAESTTFTMDSVLVEKYGKVISDLIMNCKDIKAEDKTKLIKATTSYEVAKGTIQNAMGFGKKLQDVVEDVKPVFMMRNIKVD